MADTIEMVTPYKPAVLLAKEDSREQQPTPLAQPSAEDGSRSRLRITAILLALSVRNAYSKYRLTLAKSNL